MKLRKFLTTLLLLALSIQFSSAQSTRVRVSDLTRVSWQFNHTDPNVIFQGRYDAAAFAQLTTTSPSTGTFRSAFRTDLALGDHSFELRACLPDTIPLVCSASVVTNFSYVAPGSVPSPTNVTIIITIAIP